MSFNQDDIERLAEAYEDALRDDAPHKYALSLDPMRDDGSKRNWTPGLSDLSCLKTRRGNARGERRDVRGGLRPPRFARGENLSLFKGPTHNRKAKTTLWRVRTFRSEWRAYGECSKNSSLVPIQCALTIGGEFFDRAFRSPEERRTAWQFHRAQIVRLYRNGRPPAAWGEFESR